MSAADASLEQPQQLAVTQLGPFNTITLASGTPQQLVGPAGHYNLTLFNSGANPVYISGANTVGANATSFALPINMSVTMVVWGATGVWVSSGAAAGSVSALLQPRGY